MVDFVQLPVGEEVGLSLNENSIKRAETERTVEMILLRGSRYQAQSVLEVRSPWGQRVKWREMDG